MHHNAQNPNFKLPKPPYPMTAPPRRIVVYAKDIMTITGCSSRTARRRLSQVRKAFNKPAGTYISVEEFCTVTGLPPENVRLLLT